MNTLLRHLAALPLLVAVEAQAGETDRLAIACPATHLPSHADVVRVFDEHNFGKVHQLRQRLLEVARSRCRAGVGRVDIVAVPERRPAQSRIAAR